MPYVTTPGAAVYNFLNNASWAPPPRPAVCGYYPAADFPGGDLFSFGGAASEAVCCARCAAQNNCAGFAYVAAASTCYLKDSVPQQPVSKAGVVAGKCSTPANPPLPPGALANVTEYVGTDAAGAVALLQAGGFDTVIVSVAVKSSEGGDRDDLSVPAWQDALAAAVLAAAPAAGVKPVVVARCAGACFMPWLDAAPAVLYQLMPGQEGARSMARALWGAVNPSGKLPISFPRTMNDTWLGSPPRPEQYPGVDQGKGWPEVQFSEGLFVGYRWYDAHLELEPLWPFGHGLSYTRFEYSQLRVSGAVGAATAATVSVVVTNVGAVAGAEVVQLYVAHPAAADEPPKALKGFDKVALAPGQAHTVVFSIAASDIAIFDVVSDNFLTVPGTYGVLVGSSSRDIRLVGEFVAGK
jgi:beta-glucosidase